MRWLACVLWQKASAVIRNFTAEPVASVQFGGNRYIKGHYMFMSFGAVFAIYKQPSLWPYEMVMIAGYPQTLFKLLEELEKCK